MTPTSMLYCNMKTSDKNTKDRLIFVHRLLCSQDDPIIITIIVTSPGWTTYFYLILINRCRVLTIAPGGVIGQHEYSSRRM